MWPRAQALRLLDLVALADLADRWPAALSGASSSASRWPTRWPASHWRCCWTSRFQLWTAPRANGCRSRSWRCVPICPCPVRPGRRRSAQSRKPRRPGRHHPVTASAMQRRTQPDREPLTILPPEQPRQRGLQQPRRQLHRVERPHRHAKPPRFNHLPRMGAGQRIRPLALPGSRRRRGRCCRRDRPRDHLDLGGPGRVPASAIQRAAQAFQTSSGIRWAGIRCDGFLPLA